MDDSDEVYGELWDVGCGAGANPYVVDSWPMEPNVLAAKCNKNTPFGEGIAEETEQDLDDDSLEEEPVLFSVSDISMRCVVMSCRAKFNVILSRNES